MQAKRVRGDKLLPHVKAQVLNAFIYRMTTEARQRWPEAARTMLAGGYRMPERTDAEWLAATDFFVTDSGELDRRYRHCESNH